MSFPPIRQEVIHQGALALFMRAHGDGMEGGNYIVPGSNGKTLLEVEMARCADLSWKMAEAVWMMAPDWFETGNHKR